EGCDDGNNLWHDGCSVSCEKEEGWLCYNSPSVCSSNCGDGVIVGEEECDDANLTNGDGCSAQCETESGWSCDDDGKNCTTLCGDNIQAGAEACDDGNTNSDDGCSATCALEGVSGSFTNITDAELSTEYISNALTILETGSDVVVTINGGDGTEKLFKNSVNTEVLTSTFVGGDKLSVAMTSSDLYLTQTSLTISMDGVDIIWSITTIPDNEPNPFTFLSIDNAVPDEIYLSEEIEITGVDTSILFSVSGLGECSIILNGVDSEQTSLEVEVGDKIKIQATSASTDDASTIYAIHAGAYSTSWTITTGNPVCAPGQLIFNATGAAQSFTLPPECDGFSIQAWGAGGAGTEGDGGGGGYATVTGFITSGGVFDIIVGEGGEPSTNYIGGPGGYPNGGDGGTLTNITGNVGGPGGGGRSEVHLGNELLAVAGGGGGGDAYRPDEGGAGGGLRGAGGGGTEGGEGGTQTAPGQPFDPSDGNAGGPFFGGDGGISTIVTVHYGGGGGGDGYFGGASGSNAGRGGGGGGSGFRTGDFTGLMIAGNGSEPGGTAQPGYLDGIGEGGQNDSPGGNGMVIISYY
ncbi:DUF4215 domain-containing protein, partial [Myxococcota bacterium]|nr:DUF4215 domain-containing protein [Myxococcota bacterium]